MRSAVSIRSGAVVIVVASGLAALAAEPLPSVELGENLQLGGATSVAFSADGKTLLLISGGGFRLLDAATARVVSEGATGDPIDHGTLLGDGRVFAVGEQVHLGSGSAWTSFKAGRRSNAIAALPDGKTVAIGGRDGVALVDVESRKVVRELGGRDVTALGVFPDGKRYAVATSLGAVSIRDLADGKELLSLASGTMREDRFKRVAVSSDGKLVAFTADRAVKVVDVQGAEVAKLEGHTGRVGALAFSPDGKQLATGGAYDDFSVRLWDAATWKAAHVLEGHELQIRQLAYAPDGKTLASASGDAVVLWDPVTGKATHKASGHKGRVVGAFFSADGATLVTGEAQGSRSLVIAWDRATWSARTQRVLGLATLMGFSGDRILMTNGPRVAIVGLEKGDAQGTLDHGKDQVSVAAFSPDGNVIATGTRGGALALWDAATGQKVATLAGPSSELRCLSFAPDGKVLATVERDGTVRFMDVAGRKEVAKTAFAGSDHSLSFSPDGALVVLGAGRSGRVAIHEVATGGLVRKLEDHGDGVYPVFFAGDRVVTVDGAGMLRLFEAATGRELAKHELPSRAKACAISPDHRLLVTAEGRRVLAWDLAGVRTDSR